MPRAKRGVKARRRRNRVLKEIKGFRGKRGNCFAVGNEALSHAYQHMYVGRKLRKRDFRSLWIARISAACRPLGQSYSGLMGGLKKSDVALNRKMLAEIAIHDPAAFEAVVKIAA
ncbi:MAG TPA: 50S ribosomal protein L20 [Kofleriaceae bacterium]|nr:50S ribosomal protein L20 [Kofleriaceae bacterium]